MFKVDALINSIKRRLSGSEGCEQSAPARLSGTGKAELAVGEEEEGAAAPGFPVAGGWAMLGAQEKGQGSFLGVAGSPPGSGTAWVC